MKYQDIARMLGLPCATPEEGVRSYAQACYDLAVRCGIKMSFKEQGLDEKAWMDARHDVALLAFEDQCSPANPRLPMVEDMQVILTRAYYGYDRRIINSSLCFNKKA